VPHKTATVTALVSTIWWKWWKNENYLWLT